ncbi:MAG: GspE/PulE/PilB domain-containing protein, partial [Planctomycetota bacterium]
MAEQLDVYRDWLGITEDARPLSYYQLLRLKQFEDNTATIRAHYRKMHARVRKFATGPQSGLARELLNELARAMLCLTDAHRKREYDASLGRKQEGPGQRRRLEEILLANKVVDQEQLDRARRFADQVGLDVRDAILQQKLAPSDAVMLAYAESEGMPYIELGEVGVDEQLVAQIPPVTARQHSCVPIMTDGGQVLMASPNPLVPDVEEELRLRFGVPIRTVLCTPVSLNQAIAKYYPRDAAGPVAAPAPAKKKAAPKKAAAEREAKPVTTKEQTRQRLLFSVIAFNLAVILVMLFRGDTNAFLAMVIAVLV